MHGSYMIIMALYILYIMHGHAIYNVNMHLILVSYIAWYSKYIKLYAWL